MEHSFNIEIATDLKSVNMAVIIKNLDYWLSKNKANEKHYHDGEFWTYNSAEAFTKLFPYLTAHQVRRIIDKLIKLQIIKTGKFNKSSYDQTRWFTFTNAFCKKYNSILQFCKMDFDKLQNGSRKIDQPIPDSKPFLKPDEKTNEGEGEKKTHPMFKEFQEKIKVEYPTFEKFDLQYYFDRVTLHLKIHDKKVKDFTAYAVSFMQGDEKEGKAKLKPVNNSELTFLRYNEAKDLETRKKEFWMYLSLSKDCSRYKIEDLESFFNTYSQVDDTGIMFVEKRKYSIDVLLNGHCKKLKK